MTVPADAAPLPSIPAPAGAAVEPAAFADVPGWAADDHAEAFRAWLGSCRAVAATRPALRPGRPPPPALRKVCRLALKAGPLDAASARTFFERHFAALRIRPGGGEGFFTGYYEPEFEGALVAGGRFATPLYGLPADLVTLPADHGRAGLDGLGAARRRTDGGLEPYPDRAAIEDGALAGQGLERAFLADPVDRFFMQVQGSGRVRLPDGGVLRMAYAGKNGRPYTPIGRIVADREGIPRRDMTMAVLRAWLAADPARAKAVMRENASFVFFRPAGDLHPAAGPLGGEGVPLTARRSLAVDHAAWPYGLPVFVDTTVPAGAEAGQPFRRLMVAQDTGSAIVGPARGDIFFGSGAGAGAIAGDMRHAGGFIVLWPKSASPARGPRP